MPRNDPFVPTGRKTRWITPSTTVEKSGLISIDPCRDRNINSTFGISRMGRRHKEVADEEKNVPYEVTGGADELVKIQIRDKEYTPPEISAMILQDLKKTAEDYLGEKVEAAVITVPAYFNDSQKKATKEAGIIAGFDVKRVLPEPTAAALAYGMANRLTIFGMVAIGIASIATRWRAH